MEHFEYNLRVNCDDKIISILALKILIYLLQNNQLIEIDEWYYMILYILKTRLVASVDQNIALCYKFYSFAWQVSHIGLCSWVNNSALL